MLLSSVAVKAPQEIPMLLEIIKEPDTRLGLIDDIKDGARENTYARRDGLQNVAMVVMCSCFKADNQRGCRISRH